MSKKIENAIESLIKEPIEQSGFELADIEYKKENGDWVLTAYIYSDNGVFIDDCERISRLIDPILDEADPIEQPYILSVSSVGLDRALKKPRDFERNIGKEIIVRLYAQVDGVKEYQGVLVSCDEQSITLDLTRGKSKKGQKQKETLTQKQITVNKEDFASAKLFIDFNEL